MKPNKINMRLPLSGEAGQALVEYILIIVVTISLLLAAAKFFFKPAQEWMNHYIGDYIYCVMDQGVLPGLGGEEEIDGCEKQFEEFSFAGGKGKKSGSSASEDALKKAQEGGGDGGGSGSGRRRRGGGRNYARNTRIGDATGGADSGGTKSEKVQEVGNKAQAQKYMRISNAGTYSGGENRTRLLGLAGLIESEKEKIKKREARISVAAVESEQIGSLKQRKMLLKPQERKIAIEAAKEEEFNLGRVFRIAIILMIIVGIGFVLFSQINAVMKSSEK